MVNFTTSGTCEQHFGHQLSSVSKHMFFLFFLDLFFYLKDPPPEFLPRFGTITMAGLLGMFLARKGDVTFPY